MKQNCRVRSESWVSSPYTVVSIFPCMVRNVSDVSKAQDIFGYAQEHKWALYRLSTDAFSDLTDFNKLTEWVKHLLLENSILLGRSGYQELKRITKYWNTTLTFQNNDQNRVCCKNNFEYLQKYC